MDLDLRAVAQVVAQVVAAKDIQGGAVAKSGAVAAKAGAVANRKGDWALADPTLLAFHLARPLPTYPARPPRPKAAVVGETAAVPSGWIPDAGSLPVLELQS